MSSFPKSPISLRLRLRDEARLGPGKIALLEAIMRTGSIAEAGRSLDMSERRASLLVDSLTTFFGQPILLTEQTSGRVRVSPLGEALIKAFRAVEKDAQTSFDQHFAEVSARMLEKR